MAERAQPLTWVQRTGVATALAIPVFILVSVAALIGAADPGEGLKPSDWAAIRFTVAQAIASSLISVLLAIPVARALARQNFPGRNVLITLLGAPFLLPVIVAVFGLITVFGRNGLINQGLSQFGFEPFSIYGFHGVVLAHVFFNLPLAIRLILQGWLDIPGERFRLAATLGMDARAVGRHLERPMLRQVLPGAALLIFVICLTSFAVALTLGGGPRATTVELAIYQALRFEFDLTRAAILSLVQLVLTLSAALLALRFARQPGFSQGLDRSVPRSVGLTGAHQLLDRSAIFLTAAFLLVPILTLVVRGAPELISLPIPVWEAALRSIIVALIATALAVGMSLLIALAAIRLPLIEAASIVAIAASPLVLGTGLFLILHPWTNPEGLALPVTAIVNAIVTLPFALRALLPAIRTAEADFGRLADALTITGWHRFRLVLLPRIKRPLGFAAGLAAALSMGDLGVVALFADPDGATLPLQVFRLMGAYRMEDAAGASVLLLILSFGLFWLFDRSMRRAEA